MRRSPRSNPSAGQRSAIRTRANIGPATGPHALARRGHRCCLCACSPRAACRARATRRLRWPGRLPHLLADWRPRPCALRNVAALPPPIAPIPARPVGVQSARSSQESAPPRVPRHPRPPRPMEQSDGVELPARVAELVAARTPVTALQATSRKVSRCPQKRAWSPARTAQALFLEPRCALRWRLVARPLARSEGRLRRLPTHVSAPRRILAIVRDCTVIWAQGGARRLPRAEPRRRHSAPLRNARHFP